MYKIIAFCKWCERLPLVELAAHLQKVGADGVDLPCRPGPGITPEEAAERLPQAKRVFEDHGLTLDRIATGIREASDEADRQLEAIRSVGVKKIRLGCFWVGLDGSAGKMFDEARRKLPALQRLLEKHEVMGAIQNHSGMCLEVNVSSTLRLIEDCDPRWVGVQCDPGHLTVSGERYKMAFDILGPRLHSVNFKSPRQDCCADPQTGRLTFETIWVPLRDGMLEVPGVLKQLKAVGYADPISIHAEYGTHYYYFGGAPECVEKTGQLVADDIAYVRRMIAENL